MCVGVGVVYVGVVGVRLCGECVGYTVLKVCEWNGMKGPRINAKNY